MDLTGLRGKALGLLRKYRYVLLVLLIGIALMLIPADGKSEAVTEPVPPNLDYTDDAEALTQILSQIQGAGKVKLLLTTASGERVIYQTDTDAERSDTVLITDAERAQQGLVQQVLAPEYRGAVVVCQGAGDVAVRLAIVEAVSSATGLGADRITVLKMK